MLDLSEFDLPPGALPGDPRLRLRTPNVTPSAAGVREYAAGDAFSRIHWPTTARQRRYLVRFQSEQSVNQRLHTCDPLERSRSGSRSD